MTNGWRREAQLVSCGIGVRDKISEQSNIPGREERWISMGDLQGVEEERNVPSSGLGASTPLRNKWRREAELEEL